MSAIRDFVIRTLLQGNDEAKDGIQETLDLAQRLTENAYDVVVDADTSGVDALVESVDQLGESEQEASSLTEYLTSALESVQSVAEGVSEKVGDMVESISAAKLAAGAAVALGADQVFKMQETKDALTEHFSTTLTEAQSDGVNKWLGNRPPEVSFTQRAKAYLDLTFHKIGSDQAMEATKAVEEFVFPRTAELGEQGVDTSSIIETLSGWTQQQGGRQAMSKNNLASMGNAGRVLARMGIDSPTDQDMAASRAHLETTGELTGKTKQQADAAILLGAVLHQLQSQYKAVDYSQLDASQQMEIFNADMSDMTQQIETGALPYLLMLVDMIHNLVDVVESVPGLPQVLGMITVFTILMTVLGPLMGVLGPVIGLFTGAAEAVGMVSIAVAEGTTVIDALVGVLIGVVGWPLLIVAGLVALGVGLYEVEQKTHAFSNAWAAFSQSSIGKDLINDVQMLVGLLSGGAADLGGHFLQGAVQGVTVFEEVIGGAFEKADGLYKFLKAHDALDVVLGFAIGGPIGALITGIPAIEAHLDPIDSFTKLIYYLIRELLTADTDFVTWIKGVWSDVVNAVLGIAKPITDELERLGNWFQGKGYQTNAELAKSQSAGGTTPALNLDTTQMPPGYKTAPGEGDQLILVGPDGKSIGAATYNHLPDNQNPDLMKQAWDDYYKNHPDAKKPDTPTPSTPAPRNVLSDARAGLSQGVNNELQNQEQQFNAWDKNQVGPASASVDQGPVALFKYGYSAAMGLIDNLKGTPTPTPTPTTDTTPSSPTPSSPTPITQYKSKIDGHIIDKNTYDNYLVPDQQLNYVPAQKGGLITSSGGLIGHEGEPIIPAEIASSSRLQEILESLIDSPVAVMPPKESYSGGTAQPVVFNLGGISVPVTINGSTDKLDEDSIIQKIKDVLETRFNDFEMSRLIEEVVKRGSAHYGGGS